MIEDSSFANSGSVVQESEFHDMSCFETRV